MLLPPCLKAGDLLPVKRQHEEISHPLHIPDTTHPLHIPDTSHSLHITDTTHSLAAGGALLRHSQSDHQHQITGDETGHMITGACEADEPDAEAIPGVRVITAEEIRLRGVARMDELFSLIDTWSGFTINGQDWSTTSPAQGIYEGTGWSLWIDRHPIPLTTLGWHSVNHLPVSLQEIEKVVILDTPVPYQGIFTGQGLIHIITTRCRKGVRAEARFAAGNEINDPGPWEFTDHTSPNVERTGPDIDLVTGYGDDRWHLQASGSLLRHRNTDTPIEQRIKEMLFTGDGFAEPTSRREALQLRGGFRSGQLTAGFHGGTYHHRDFPFFRSLGREVPVLFRSLYGGVNLSLPVGQVGDLYLRSDWQKREPDYLPNREQYRFSHLQRDLNTQATLIRSRERRHLSVSIQLDQTDLEGAVSEDFEPLRIGSLHTGWTERLSNRFQVAASARLAVARDEEALSTSVYGNWNPSGRHRFSLWIARHEELAAERRDMLFWIDQGYDTVTGLAEGAESQTLEPLMSGGHGGRQKVTTSAGIDWHYRVSASAHLTVQSMFRHHNHLRLQRYRFSMVHPYQWFSHEGGTLFEDEWASTVGLNLTAEVGQSSRLRHRLFIGLREVTGGSREMRRSLDEIPARRLKITTTWLPVNGFHLWSSLRLASGTTWHEFEAAEGELVTDQQQLVQQTFRYQTDPVIALEAGTSKYLWSDRAALTFMVRNLLNRSQRLHPAGAGEDLTFTIQMTISL